eukprot:5091530-Pleurochrysis_carterae.AAC.1
MSKCAERCGTLFGCWAHVKRRCTTVQSEEDSTLGPEKDRGATTYLGLRAGALRQRLRQRHLVEGRPASAAMEFLEHRIPYNRTE